MSSPPALTPLQADVVQLLKPLIRAICFPLQQASPLYWPFLLSTPLFALLAWWLVARRGGQGLAGFLREHLGAAVWGHASARADYRYYLLNAMVFALLFAPLIVSGVGLAELLRGALQHWWGDGPQWAISTGVRVAYTLLFFIAYDFGRWLAHTWLHDVPLLWKFHQVHHSAEVLTPFTAFRVHPVDLFVTFSVPVLVSAPVTAAFLYLFPGSVTGYVFLGATFFIGLTGLIANLKHSHVWIGYGPLNRWWISPAHHQLHHSADPKHWGKNRGFEIGLWDRLAGTLYIPSSEREVFVMGLGDGRDAEWHSVSTLFLRPFREAWTWLRSTLPGGAAIALVGVCVLLPMPKASAADSVYMEELTWPELSQRIAGGATVVLVPVGGTEQNGPQMALGKHNDIVRYSAGEIARRLGNALVAPVLPFAPEGNLNPRSGNLQWLGTIGLRERTLTAVLEDEVISLLLHGFRSIVLLGDHGGSQAVQAEVAKRLGAAVAGRGIVIASLSRYYEPASIEARALALKLPKAAVGDHAGLVDTAELLSVRPEQVRRERLAPEAWKNFPTPPGAGASGNPSLATPEIGRALLEQRISAGLAQLRPLLAQRP